MKPSANATRARCSVWFPVNPPRLGRLGEGGGVREGKREPDGVSCSSACSSDCTLCEEVGRCEACREPTFLMEGYCTPSCGHGYYAEQKTRTCQGDKSRWNWIKTRRPGWLGEGTEAKSAPVFLYKPRQSAIKAPGPVARQHANRGGKRLVVKCQCSLATAF